MESTTYEVQVMQGGKWRIHAQFPPNGRDDALEEAESLESMPGISGIKVVRDTYDDRSGLHREHVIFKSKPSASAAQSSTASGGGGGKYDHYMARASANRLSDFDDPFAAKDKSKKTSSGFGILIKILLVLLFSIAVGLATAGFLQWGLPKKLGDIWLVGTMRANTIMGGGLSAFLLSAIVMFKAFMGGDELDAIEMERLRKLKLAALEAKRKQVAKQKAAQEKKEEKKEEKKRSKEEEEELKRKAEEELKRKAEEEVKQAKEDDKEEAKDEPGIEAEEEEEEFSNLSPMAEKQKALLMGFFGEAVRALPPERRKMDNYNRFGVNLYLAGAVEALGGERNLDGETMTIILADALQVMGLKAEHAEAFARRYEDYLLQDARYMEMFQAGRRSISDFIGGNKESAKELNTALHEWNKPKAPEDPEKEVVVMFTDIVGSTAMTHEKGNLAAQEVVRAHNRVVRDALAKTSGKEIKHTGDGIMASFDNVTNSLLATQQMQMMIRLHNGQNPDVPLKVKVGINAGRVVMEEQDLYGVTVQMAARIVDKAKGDQIFVSDTVYGMAKGGSWRFVTRGPYFLKGIDGPAYLHECVWDDKTDVATVEAQAQAERPALEQAYAAASGTALPPQPEAAQPEAAQPASEVPTTPAQGEAQPQPAAQQAASQPAPAQAEQAQAEQAKPQEPNQA
ncbi:adenylate/guanylate cyclase domain-containing protein [Pseudomonadota bacterium]